VLLLVVVVASVVSVLVLAADDDPTGVWFAVGVTALLVAVAAVFGRLGVRIASDEPEVLAAALDSARRAAARR